MQMLVFRDFISMEKLYLFTDIGSDTITMQYPEIVNKDRHFQETGSELRWSFQAGMGQNMYRGFRVNPVELIRRYILAPLPIEKQFIFLEMLKILLGGIFFFLFLRQLRISVWASTLGGIAMAFSGYMIVGGSWYVHSSLIWQFCFLLLCFEGLLQRKWFRWLIPLAVFWIGISPQLYLGLIFLITYGIYRLGASNTLTVRKVGSVILRMIVMAILGLMLNGPGLASQYLRYLDSPRMLGDSLWQTLAKSNLFQLETPLHYQTIVHRLLGNDLLGTANDFHGWNNYLEAPLFYVGVLALLVLPILFYQLNKRERIAHGLLLAFWAVIVIVPIFRFGLYFFTGDFFKIGLSIFIPVLLIYSMARGLHSFAATERVNFPSVLLGGVLLCLALFSADLGGYGDILDSNLRNIQLGFVLLFTLLLCLFHFQKARPVLKILIVLLLCSELSYSAWHSLAHRDALPAERFEKRLAYNDYTIDALDAIQKRDDGFYRIEKFYSSCPKANVSFNDARAQNFFGTSSYASFNQPNYLAYMLGTGVISNRKTELKWVTGLKDHPALQAGTAVKYHYRKSTDIKEGEVVFERAGNISVQEFPYFQPLGLCYDNYIKKSVFNKLSFNQKALTLLKAVVLDDREIGKHSDLVSFRKRALPKLDKASFNNYYKNENPLFIDDFSNQHISGLVEIDKPKTMVLSMPFSNGWKVEVNGEEVETHLVQLGFIGFNLNQGKHKIEIKFRPPNYWFGIGVSIAAFVMYGLLVVFSIVRSKE